MRHTKDAVVWANFSALCLTLLAFLNISCTTETEDDDTTNTLVAIVDMSGESATGSGMNAGADIFSDICADVTEKPGICVAFNDNGIVVMQAQPKDLLGLASTVQDIVFSRYRVTYTRADGRNVQGVDVPYSFDGVSNFRVPADGSQVTRVFMVVRQQAKLESPLTELGGGGGAQVISTLAQIDFYGSDLAGRQVQVRGYLNITFGDF